ncbi:Ash2-trithorax family protein [Metarhizium album ARSEF 1941]|uniref:Ash2-trithorax family protein n=1 Tax=Metarhizium album (strain ARSEF 1941) TaxID=1081103 RepID=A0A0B2WV95_METAS|nr:Ash2-trithorax family protein [Metarhizium album ARSEF 1941]KHN97998.1 Ash2-trithorax family protein [Metarhizium album ARSEF 1941]
MAAETGASTGAESPKREPTSPTSLGSIPQKRLFEDDHSPAVPSPLNPDASVSELPLHDDASQSKSSKPARAKKDSLKKRETKGGGRDSSPATPDHRSVKEQNNVDSPLRYKLAPPKPSDFEPPRGPVMTPHHEIDGVGGRVEFFETSDHVFNKKNFRYTHCIADPLFPSTLYYRQTEAEPFGPRMSYEDAATSVFFDKSGRGVTTDKGFRMARANVAVREGRWYWECKVTQGVREAAEPGEKPEGGKHVRMGWARREASLDAPVGFDAYSYGIRDVAGEKVFMSRPKPFFPAGDGIREGDVIGLEIQLPSENMQRKIMSSTYNPAIDVADDERPPGAEAPNIVRDRVPIRFKAHTYFEKIEYHTTKELEDLMNPSSIGSSSSSGTPHPLHPTPALRSLPNSCIKIYKNGQLVGTAFENLLGFLPPASKPQPQVGAREGLDDGMLGYYPAVSVFRGGAAQVNFGPDFWYPPPGFEAAPSGGEDTPQSRCRRLRAVSERYREQIAEDIVYDIIDEVDFWMQDGGGATDTTGVQDKSEAVAAAPGTEEIKELVQDD